MSNSLDPDQARQYVEPDLGLTVCQDDDTGRQRVNVENLLSTSAKQVAQRAMIPHLRASIFK